jgi:hypothetical protein
MITGWEWAAAVGAIFLAACIAGILTDDDFKRAGGGRAFLVTLLAGVVVVLALIAVA